MTPRISIPCPSCGHELRVRTEYLGRKVVCKYCGSKFPVVAPLDQSTDAEEPSELNVIEQMFLDEAPASASRAEAPSTLVGWPSGELEDEESPAISATRTEPGPAEGPPAPGVENLELARKLEAERLRSDELQAELADSQAELRRLRELADTLRARADEAGRLEAVAESSRDELDHLRAELTDARDEVDAARAERDRLIREAEDRQSLLAERDRLSEELEASRVDSEERAAERVRTGRLEDDFAAVRDDRDRLSAELVELRAELEAHTAASERLTDVEIARDKAQAEHYRLSEEVRVLRASLEAAESRERASAQEAGRLDRERGDLSRALEEAEGERDRFSEESLALRSSIEAAEARERASSDEAEQLRARLDERERTTSQEVARLEMERDELARALGEARESHEAERLALADRANRSQAEERARAESELSSLQGQFSEERDRRSRETDSLREEAETARRSHEAALAQLHSLGCERDHLASLQDEVRAAHRDEVKRLELALADACARAESSDRRADEFQVQIHSLRSDIEAHRIEAESDASANRSRISALEAARSAAEAEQTRTAHASDLTLASYERELAEVRAELRASLASHDLTEQQARSSSDSTAALHEELALSRQKIAELEASLKASRQTGNQIRSLLSGMGIHVPE